MKHEVLAAEDSHDGGRGRGSINNASALHQLNTAAKRADT